MLPAILAHKRRELLETMAEMPLEKLRASRAEAVPPSFAEALNREGVRIIAEVKFSSPSRGDFPCSLSALEVAQGYAENGAAAVSVLTDKHFFKGSPDSLKQISQALPELPVLRKDFIVDPYQVIEAAVWGASAYLLIVACLTDRELASLLAVGRDHGIEPLVEVHDLWELERALELGCRTIGVNNRNLKTFTVDLDTSFQLARRLEGEREYLLVSESGITEPLQIEELRDAGFSAFLVGSHFMEAEDPGRRLAELLRA